MNYIMTWGIYYGWLVAEVAFVALVICALCRRPRSKPHPVFALVFSVLGNVVTILTIFYFTKVFIIGKSSNVAQMAGRDGEDLWSLWFHVWEPLLLFTPLSCTLCVLGVACPPWPPREKLSFLARICAALAIIGTAYMLMTYFPDA